MKNFSWRKHRVAIACSSLALVLLAGGILFLRPKPTPPIVIDVEPPERDEITSFGAIRYVYAQDGTTVIEKHIPYADGGLGHQFYRPDGTLKETAEHWPVRAGSTQPVLKSKSTWMPDGKTLQTGEVYRPDGSLWFTYKNLGNDRRQDAFYFKGGWKFSESEYKPGDNTKETTYYQSNGNVWAKEVQEKSYSSYSDKSTTVFDSTGTRMLFKTASVGWNETVDGFHAVNTTGKLVTYYDDAGKPTHRQFVNSQWNWFMQTQGCMMFLHVYDQFGTIAKTYELEDSQDTIKLKSWSKPDGSRKVFRDFGKNLRKVSIEKVTVQGQPKERFLQMGTCSYELDAQGVRTEHDDADRVYDLVDITQFAQASDQDLRERKTAAQAENKGVLGLRDDTDPVKWYHKQ